MVSVKAVRVSPSWLGAALLVASLALWPIGGFGGEAAISRELILHGQNLVGQLAEPVAEMKRQLTSLGCNEFSLTYWSDEMPTRLHVEVRCRSWTRDVPLDASGAVGLVSHGSTAGQ